MGRDQGRALHGGLVSLVGIPVLTTQWAPPNAGSSVGTGPASECAWENSRVGGPWRHSVHLPHCWEEDKARGQEERGLKLLICPVWRREASQLGPSSTCWAGNTQWFFPGRFSGPSASPQHCGAPGWGCGWQPFPDLLSQNIKAAVPWHPVWEMLARTPGSRQVAALFCRGL